MKHLIEKGWDKPFLTHSFTDISYRYLVFAYALVDIALCPQDLQDKKLSHKFTSDSKRGITITAGSNAILFKKEIKEGECQIKNDLMVTHRYTSLKDSNKDNDEVESMVINHPY